MEEQGELKIPVTEAERARIRRAAEAQGLDVETWVREVLLQKLLNRDAEH